jgi:protein-S-isoprenylcysteine O-methyltransferase Ste14
MDHTPAYGLWTLVFLNSLVFILFAFSFTKPRNARDWRGLGAFSAFIVALFTEMYGFPLTVYLLSSWIGTRFPGLDLFSHESGHLWHTLLGLQGDPHFDVLHILSTVFIVGGFWLLASAWRVLHAAQRSGTVATTGAYAYVRHPQYDALYRDHARVPAAMADPADALDVPGLGLRLHAPRAPGGARGDSGIRGSVPGVHAADAAIYSAVRDANNAKRGVRWLSVGPGKSDPVHPLRSPLS